MLFLHTFNYYIGDRDQNLWDTHPPALFGSHLDIFLPFHVHLHKFISGSEIAPDMLAVNSLINGHPQRMNINLLIEHRPIAFKKLNRSIGYCVRMLVFFIWVTAVKGFTKISYLCFEIFGDQHIIGFNI